MSEVRSPKFDIFSLREKRWLMYIIFFVIISRVLLMFRSEEKIFARPYFEDSFYLFNCAEHFAHGEGFTCDGKQPTNGVQPLIVVLYAPLFLIAGENKLLALKFAFILIALFDSLSVIFIARVVRLMQKKPIDENSVWYSPSIIAAILWAGLYPIFVHTGSGLETGLYSTMLLASLCYYLKLSRIRSAGGIVAIVQWILYGSILGITVLARIDAVFFVIAIACYEFYKFRSKGFVNGAILSFFAFMVSSPWWWYNYKIFGSLMPQSGVAESLGSLAGENLTRAAIVLGDIFSIFIFLPNYSFFPWFHYAWFTGLFIIVWWLTKKFALSDHIKEKYELSPLTPYFFFCGLIAIYYVVLFSAPYFIPRYFQPLRIGWLIIFCCASQKIIDVLKIQYKKRKGMVGGFLSIFAFIAIGFSAGSYIYFFTITHPSELYLTGKWAFTHPNKRIGMAQTGTAGFMAPNVVNLDGKVNFDALLAKKNNDIGSYIESEKLDYIADWRELSEPMVVSAAKHGGKFKEVDSIGRVVVFKRVRNSYP